YPAHGLNSGHGNLPLARCRSVGLVPNRCKRVCALNTFEANRTTALIAWRQSFRAGLAVNDACRLLCSRHAPPPAVEIIDSRSSSEKRVTKRSRPFLKAPFTWVLAGGLKHWPEWKVKRRKPVSPTCAFCFPIAEQPRSARDRRQFEFDGRISTIPTL